MNSNYPNRFLPASGVAARYSIGVSTVWYWVKKGLLPKPQKIGPNTSRWDVNELDAFDASRDKRGAGC